MTQTPNLRPEFILRSEAELRALFPPARDLVLKKCLDYVDAHAQSFIERAPFVCVGTQSRDGRADVSPRGDPCGFVKVLDQQTLLLPDRPGNNRLDTLSNLVANPQVGLLFLIPGFEDTMRVNGRATLTRDPELLAMLAVNDRVPTIAVAIHVAEVFIHCAKALRRSRLWQADQQQDRSALPSLMKIMLDQTGGAPADPAEQQKIDDDLEARYRQTMY